MNNPEENETLRDALRAYGMKQDIHRIHKEMMLQMHSGKNKITPLRSLSSYASRIAAGILILVIAAGILVYINSTPSTLFKDKYVPYEESTQRGNAPAASAIKNKFTDA